MTNPTTETKPDWIAATLSGQLKDTNALLPLNLKAKDFDFRSPDDYWAKDSVKQMFKGNKADFDTFYEKEKVRYDRTQSNDYELDTDADVFVDKWSVRPQVSYSFKDNTPDPWGRDRFGDFYSPKRWTIQEKAIETGVRQSDGSYIPMADFKGTVRLAKNSDGTYKFNEQHKPYWEPLGEGEEIKTTDEIYSKFAKWSGAYGVDNNWLKEGLYSVGKTLYNFAFNASDSLLEVPRQLGTVMSGGNQTGTVADWQTKLRGFELPESVGVQEGGFFNPSNLLSVGVDSALQLLSMGGVSRAAMALGGNPKTASIAGQAFMTGIAAGQIAQISREHNLNPYETAVLYGLTTYGVYKIAALSDMAVNGIRRMEFQQLAAKEIKDAFGVTLASRGFNQAGMKAFVDQIGSRFKNAVGSISKLGTAGEYAQTGVLESTEEVLEQVLDSGLRGLHDLIAPIAHLDGKFNWNAGQELEGILQAGVGGFIGGNVAHGLMRKMGNYEREKIDSFEAAVAHNDEAFVGRTINNWEKAGRLGKTPEDNRSNASLMRETLNAMVEIRNRAGLNNMLNNNRLAAGKFADVLKKSSILRDKIIAGNELFQLENQLAAAQMTKAPKETIEALTKQVDAKKEQIEQLSSGKMVDRFITEGLYNTYAEPEFFGKSFLNTDSEFTGRLFTDMNMESIAFKQTLKTGIELRNNELDNNDLVATEDNYKTIGVTAEGINRLVTGQKTKRAAMEEVIRQNAEMINGMVGYDDVSIVLDPAEGHNFSDTYLSYLEAVQQEGRAQEIESQPWYSALADLIQLDKKTREMLAYKAREKQDEIQPDDWFLYDFENGKSTVSLAQRLAAEEDSASNANTSGISTYTSLEPDRILRVIDDRLRQVYGTDVLRQKNFDNIISPGVENMQKTLENLLDLKNRFQVLSFWSKFNRENTDARILEIYGKSLREQKDTLMRIADALRQNYGAFSDTIFASDASLEEALSKKDYKLFRQVLLGVESTLNKEFKENKEKILKELEFTTDEAGTQEYTTKKAVYDYARRILSHDPILFYDALLKMIDALPESGSAPTREQQNAMILAIQNAFAGDYKLTPTHSTKVKMSFSSAINGGPGSGKTSMVIPGMAHIVNTITKGRIIVSAFKDSKGAKLTKLKTDIDKYYGRKPEFIDYNSDELLKILDDSSTAKATAIIFDEAALMSRDYLKQVQGKLEKINRDRLKTGATPLHIFYTYDSYQNGYRQKSGAQYSITSASVSLPDTPRLSFSFRSVNAPLKSIEEMMRFAQDVKGIPTPRAFEYDKNYNGVLIVNDRAKFEEHFKKIAEKQKTNNNLSELVYINTNATAKGISALGEFSVENLNSLTAQGSEWDYVIVDTDKTNIFGSRPDKAEVYTAVTRARKGVIMYVPEGTPMSSVLAEVREFTPMTPKSVSKQEMSQEITDIIGGRNTGKYSTNTIEVTTDTSLPPTPPTQVDAVETDGEMAQDSPAEIPTSEETYDPEAHEDYRKLMEPLINSGGTVTMNGFFASEGEMPLRKQMLNNPKVKRETQFYVTIAKIGSEGFQNVVGEDPQAFDGKYGIFVVGETADGKRAKLGVISNAKSDAVIRNSPLFNESLDILGSYPIDRAAIDSAMFPHPFIQNEVMRNGTLTDVREKRDMQHIRNELKEKGISSSGVLVATEDIYMPGKNKAKVLKGEPFLALSFMHSQDELLRLIRNGRIQLSDPRVQVLGLHTSKASVETVVDILKPLMVRNDSGFYTLPPKGNENHALALTLYNSFWADHRVEKQRVFREVYDDVKKSFIGDEEMEFFFKNQEVEKRDDGFTLRHLLEDYVSGMLVSDRKLQGKSSVIPKRRLFEKMMDDPRFAGMLKYSPVVQNTGTNTNYATTIPSLREMNDRFLSANYYRLEPFKMELKADLLVKPGSSILAQQPDAKTTAADPETSTTDEVYAPVKPMNYIEFKRKEFNGNSYDKDGNLIPNSPALAKRAIDKFKRDVINNHLKLVVGKGMKPQFLDVNVAMANLRDTYLDKQNENTASTREESHINFALGRNFNSLLAEYFPAINFDTRTGRYSMVNTVHKTATFSEQETQDLLADGITSIVKTYLYTTQLPDGKYLNSRHIANLIGVFRGTRFGGNSVRTVNEAEAALRQAAPKMPEAQALLDRFFSSQPREKKDSMVYSTRLVEGTSGLALTDSVLMFMMSAEKYVPGFTELTRKFSRGFEGREWKGDNRDVKYPMSIFDNSIVKDNFLEGFNTLLADSGNVKRNKASVEVGPYTYYIKETPGREDALKLIHFMGLKGFTLPMLSSWMNRRENGEKVIPGLIQDYFVSSITKFNGGNKPSLTEPINEMLEVYMDTMGLGNNFQYQTSEGRQNVLRFTSPIFHVQTYVNNLRELGEANLLANNLLVKGTDYEYSLQPFNNLGVRVVEGDRERVKPLEKMTADELLEFYLLDGFVSRIERDSIDVTVPVTVYSDSGTEMMPVFRSTKWMQKPDQTLSTLFDSNRDYLLGLEQAVLTPYREMGIPVRSIVELTQMTFAPEMAQMIRSNPKAVAGLHYDERLIDRGVLQLKPELVQDIVSAYAPESKEKFIAEIRNDINDIVEFSKTIGGRETLYDKLSKFKKYTPEQYIEAFYANWLLLSSEFQKMMNGSKYQYKQSGSKAFIDMVKRSRSLTSPAQFFVLRNENWNDQVAAFRAQNPSAELPVGLMYEGHKLNRMAKVFVVTDPESSMVMLADGSVQKQKIFDGATLVSPFTRIMQNYSSALNYGPFVGPVMKNITHTFDPETGSKAFIKNAEFELTPEILRNADEQAIRYFKNMVSQPFSQPTPVGNSAWEVLQSLGVAEDLSNITFDHFDRAMTEIVKYGEQDSIVQEIVFQSSMKTGQRGVNLHDAPQWTPTFIDISLKGIQQDAMKDPSSDLSIKPLTQLINTVAVNWKNPNEAMALYQSLATITSNYLDSQEKMTPEKLRSIIMNIMRDDLLRTDGINYRTDAASIGRISINDRNLSSKYASTVTNEIKNQAVAFPLQGGHFVVHPANNLISIYDVYDDVAKKSFTALKSQLAALDPARYIIKGGPRPLAFEDAVRRADGKTLTELYTSGVPIEEIHASLQTEEWDKGFAEVLLPAEMKNEFHLQEALNQNLPIHLITADYFYQQIITERERQSAVTIADKKLQAEMMYDAFQERITGIMARIPTSGFHSALVTRIAGFMEESMNSAFVPEGLKKIQGADQDIDKGAYMTYRTLVRYAMFDPNVKKGTKINTYTPNDTKYRHLVVDKNSSLYSGITPFLGNLKRIQSMRMFSSVPKVELERIALENEIVKAIKNILANPQNIVMANTSTDDVLNPLRADRDAILEAQEMDPKNAMRYNHLMSLLKIHELNQAGGKGITGIFANGAKAYNVAYTRAKMTGNPGNLAGVDGENQVWALYSGLIGATVDNANENILGPKGITDITAPYVSYWVAIGKTNEEINELLAVNSPMFNELRKAARYDRAVGFQVSTQPAEIQSLFYNVQEWNVLSSSLVNREIPSSMEDIASYIISLENFVNYAYRDFNKKFVKLDLEKFTNPAEEDYRRQQIEQYQKMVDGSDNHTFNILDIMSGVPHMAQYQRALVAAHRQMRDIKAYDILFEMHRQDKAEARKQARQFYNYDSKQFNPDFDFIHGLFIDAYLSSRNATSITKFDLSMPEGREEFINETHDQLPLLRKKYESKNNSLIRELSVETDKRTGKKRMRLNDFFDMNDDLRTQYMEELAALDGIDRQRLFMYNLIVNRDKPSKGSLSPFFSVDDKHDYLDFLDYEMKMTPEMAIKARDSYNKLKEKSRKDFNEFAIPFKAEFNIVDTGFTNKSKYKEMDLLYVNHIRNRELRSARTSTMTIDGTPTILVNSFAVRRDFENKVWIREPKRGEDGRYNRTLPVNTFASESEFLKFSLELEYLKNKQGLAGEELMDAALIAVGKQKSIKYQKDKELNQEAKNCKLDTSTK
jgi:hypothetical protein